MFCHCQFKRGAASQMVTVTKLDTKLQMVKQQISSHNDLR